MHTHARAGWRASLAPSGGLRADDGDAHDDDDDNVMAGWLAKLWGAVIGRAPGRDALASRGENLAARYLRDRGYKVLLRNFRCDAGEIDIVARLDDLLVFVEVKTRAEDNPTPEEQVNEAKRHQITKAARFYLGRYGHPQPPARFDIIAIVWPPGRQPRIRHTENAFEATF